MSVHLQRMDDELIMTVRSDDDEGGDSIVVAFPIPDGVNELIDLLRKESGLLTFKVQHGTLVFVDDAGNRFHDDAGEHRIYSQPGPNGEWHTACTVTGCDWTPPAP